MLLQLAAKLLFIVLKIEHSSSFQPDGRTRWISLLRQSNIVQYKLSCAGKLLCSPSFADCSENCRKYSLTRSRCLSNPPGCVLGVPARGEIHLNLKMFRLGLRWEEIYESNVSSVGASSSASSRRLSLHSFVLISFNKYEFIFIMYNKFLMFFGAAAGHTSA